MAQTTQKITRQAVGAYGEKVAEAELLRRLWVPANVNASIKNAADFDIFAFKDGHTVHIRVKACGPTEKCFQYNFKEGAEIQVNGLHKTDFTILVRMGKSRIEDEFYIVPTRVVRKTLAAHRKDYLAKLTRKGTHHKDNGQWALRLSDLRSGEDRPGYGLARKWNKYLAKWQSLEKTV